MAISSNLHKVVVGLFDAAPGSTFLAELETVVDGGASVREIAKALALNPIFTDGVMGLASTPEQQAEILASHFGLTPDGVSGSAASQAIDFFASGIAAPASMNIGDLVTDAVEFLMSPNLPAEFVATATLLQNKAAVSAAYSADPANNSTNLADLQAVMQNPAITGDALLTADEIAQILAGGGGESESLTLTQRADILTGTSDDDVFFAPVTQNETGSGQLANTFETGDVLDGAGGRDVLRVNLIETGSIQDGNNSPAIAAATTSIEEVFFTAMSQQTDSGANNTTAGSTIDAGSMSDVEQWWTAESRSTVQIEDIRTRPQDTAFGMRLTDGLVGYNAFFNPLFLDGDISAQSALTLIIQEITDGQAPSATELENITVREINFSLNGVDFTLDTADIRAANTWAELETAVAAELTAQGLATLSVTHNGNGVFEINDTAGGTFAAENGESLILGVASDIDTRNRVEVGRLEEEGQITTTLILDGAGSGSQGGVVNIAAMSGDRGVEVMDVKVDRSSHITTLQSVNDPSGLQSFTNEQMLEEVFVSHVAGGDGTLQLGARTVDAQGVSTTTDDRLQTTGLTDVRVFDASGFDASLKVGAQLTAAAFDKYLAGATDAVQFSYLLGDAGSNLNLAVNNQLAGDVDFKLEIKGGAGDDRINLSGLAVKQQTSVDGGQGENTLEVNTSTGFAATEDGFNVAAAAPTDLTAAQTSFEDVSNIETVVIGANANVLNVGNQAGAAAAAAAAAAALGNFSDTTHDITAGGFGDVSNFVIATNIPAVGFVDTSVAGNPASTVNVNGTVDTRLINLDVTKQSVDVSGKNQTLGTGNSDADQAFGVIRFSNTTGSDLDLTLGNTARVSGTLAVGALTIDNTLGNTSDVRTLNLDSAGTRQTSNVVTMLNGNLVNTFNLEGTQALTITDLASAANHTATASNRDSLLVDGGMLGGDLFLGVTGAVVTAVDAALGTNRTVKLVGTAGEDDILNIRDGVTTTNATTISGFETVRFGEAAQIVSLTDFNATNVSDVDLYDLVDSNVAINLTNLRSTENVQINAVNTNGTAIAGDVTLSAANPTTGSQVNVDFASNETGANLNAGFWGTAVANLNVQDFSIISLDMGGRANESYSYDFNLNTLANPTTGNINARTLEITGGQFDAGFTNVDSLTLNQLDTALTKVDFSGYAGNFITGGWNSTQGSNAEVVVNQFGMIFDVGGDNMLFNVPASTGVPAVDTPEVQTLDFAAVPLGFGDLAVGESITITFAGGQHVFTNDTGAVILEANINNAIIADAANAPSAFNIALAGGLVQLTATRPGDMPSTTIAASDLINNVPGNVSVVTTTAGDLDATNTTGASFVTAGSDFLTKFTFTEDAFAQGAVWQIDNFQPFDGVANVTLNTQTQLDLLQLGVDSSTKITIEAGDVFWTGLTAAEQANFSATDAVTINNAAQTVISSNQDLNFTIVLTGVDAGNLGNENIVGIA